MSTAQSGNLADRVVLVTGAAGAIGAATASKLAQAGARMLLADLFPAGDERITRLQRELPEPVPYIACDISDEAQVMAMVGRALELHGRLDGAANIAGIVGPSTVTAAYPAGEFRRVVDVNVTGTWLCMKHELGAMLPRGSGAIVNVASIAGHSGEMYRAAYVASKAGVIGLTKTAAVEAAASGVRINAVSPGPVGTAQFHTNVGPPGSQRYRRVVEAIPSGRTGGPDEIADIIDWLLSDASSFVIGHEVIADGGITAEGLAAPRLVQPDSGMDE
jgi:NAD(P)-dependent dehydrogenase (short-subunit alcohol dehydrogenase family)